MVSDIETAFQNIRSANGTGGQAGYYAADRYPSSPGLNLQAPQLPLIAPEGKAAILGNDQAFFFVRNLKGNTDPAQMVPDTSKLKELIGNIFEKKTQFTLAIDADVLTNPQRFVEKYQSLRPEPDEMVRRSMLAHEAGIIAGFIQSGGVPALVHEVIREKTGASGAALDTQTLIFLQNNFNVKGVQVEQPLQSAVWQVEGPQGALYAKQSYGAGKDTTERTWQIGTQPELDQLKATGHAGAASILSAIEETRRMPTVNLTLGVQQFGRSGAGMQR